MNSEKVISENIKRLKTKLGMTQDYLTKKTNIKYTMLIKVESEKVNKPTECSSYDKNYQSIGSFN